MNPYASKTWKINDILKLSESSGLSLYSTSPIFDNSYHFQWYKDLDFNKKTIKNKNILDSWKNNFLSFLFNKPLLQESKINNSTLFEIENFINQIGDYIFNGNIEKKIVQPKKFLNYLKSNEKKKLSNEMSKLIEIINRSKSLNELFNYYNSTSELKKTWGSVLHYVALMKS